MVYKLKKNIFFGIKIFQLELEKPLPKLPVLYLGVPELDYLSALLA